MTKVFVHGVPDTTGSGARRWSRLTQYADRGWHATFYATGMEHSPTSATGTAWERTPWRATRATGE